METMNPTLKNNLQKIEDWSKDVFLFAEECLGMRPAEPVDELVGRAIKYKDSYGIERSAILFDIDKRLVYHDLTFYTIDMFKNQGVGHSNITEVPGLHGNRQLSLEAYNRAINTLIRTVLI